MYVVYYMRPFHSKGNKRTVFFEHAASQSRLHNALATVRSHSRKSEVYWFI